MERNPAEIKEKLISLIKTRGPSIPMPLSKEVEMNTIFTSAFLGELVSDKELLIANLKVGGSPIYFIPGQENQLETFGEEHLKGKEKEAFLLLKEKKFLKNSEQDPAIRVAFASLKDFAKQEQRETGLYWRYFTHKEEITEPKKPEPKQEETSSVESPPEIKIPEKEEKLEKIEIFDKSDEPVETKKIIKKRQVKKKSNTANEKFFNKVKEYLIQKGTHISGIEGFSKTDLTLKIKQNEKELILIAFNKKRVDEKDIIKAHKKAQEFRLPYKIICLGEQTKKLNEFISAIKNLEKIETIE
jgi:hypothetical protein